jgi:hypothetical protein
MTQTRQSFVMKPGLNFRLFGELIHEHLTTRCPFRRRPECSSVGRPGLLVARSQPRGSVYRPGNMEGLAHASAGSGAGYCNSVSRRMRLGNRPGCAFHLSWPLDRSKKCKDHRGQFFCRSNGSRSSYATKKKPRNGGAEVKRGRLKRDGLA